MSSCLLGKSADQLQIQIKQTHRAFHMHRSDMHHMRCHMYTTKERDNASRQQKQWHAPPKRHILSKLKPLVGRVSIGFVVLSLA